MQKTNNEQLQISVFMQDEMWGDQETLKKFAHKMAEAFIEIFPAKFQNNTIELTFADDDYVHDLNRLYRNQDNPTNVLSFPYASPSKCLGHTVLARQTIAKEAAELSLEIMQQAAYMTTHGILHLLGYDHLTQEEEERMFALEDKILAKLGIFLDK